MFPAWDALDKENDHMEFVDSIYTGLPGIGTVTAKALWSNNGIINNLKSIETNKN